MLAMEKEHMRDALHVKIQSKKEHEMVPIDTCGTTSSESGTPLTVGILFVDHLRFVTNWTPTQVKRMIDVDVPGWVTGPGLIPFVRRLPH
jgi:hypothetical protein